MLDYIQSEMYVPDEMRYLDTTLTAIVTFMVDKDGFLEDIRLKKDPGMGTGEEALRIVNNMTQAWVPGFGNGRTS